MTDLPFFQVDAFARRAFTGNPAAVVPLPAWPDACLLGAIAAENNLSETAFLVPADRETGGADYALRWFTPTVEVELCGHATLASAWVVMTHLRPGSTRVAFQTLGGLLTVTRTVADPMVPLTMDFPTRSAAPLSAHPEGLAAALGATPDTVLDSGDAWLAVFEDAAPLRALAPDFRALMALDGDRFLIVTAPADATTTSGGDPDGDTAGVDFLSRVFAPGQGINEDPVTGSAHCTLAPYWVERLGRTDVSGFQASVRGGRVDCRVMGDRVALTGTVTPVLIGTLSLPDGVF